MIYILYSLEDEIVVYYYIYRSHNKSTSKYNNIFTDLLLIGTSGGNDRHIGSLICGSLVRVIHYSVETLVLFYLLIKSKLQLIFYRIQCFEPISASHDNQFVVQHCDSELHASSTHSHKRSPGICSRIVYFHVAGTL